MRGDKKKHIFILTRVVDRSPVAAGIRCDSFSGEPVGCPEAVGRRGRVAVAPAAVHLLPELVVKVALQVSI